MCRGGRKTGSVASNRRLLRPSATARSTRTNPIDRPMIRKVLASTDRRSRFVRGFFPFPSVPERFFLFPSRAIGTVDTLEDPLAAHPDRPTTLGFSPSPIEIAGRRPPSAAQTPRSSTRSVKPSLFLPFPPPAFPPPGAPLAEPPFLRARAHRALLLPVISLSSLPPPPPRPAEDPFVPEPLGLTSWARKARAGLIWRRACSCAHAHCGASSRLCDGNEAKRRVPSVEEELRKACGASEEPRGRRRPSTRAKHEACPPRTETPKRDCASRRAARTCVKRKRSPRKTRFEARR